MLKIKRKDVGLPGGYVYPGVNGAPVTGGDYNDLVRNIRKHFRGNGQEPPTDVVIEDTICRSLPPGSTNCREYTPTEEELHPPRRTTVNDAIRFIDFAARTISAGRGFVPKEEANRRAAICAACPMNQKIEGCSKCRGLFRKVFAVIGHRSTPHDDVLLGCAVCGCENRVAVHCDLEAQQQSLSPDLRAALPTHCWKA